MTGTRGRVLARMLDIVFPGDTNHHGTLFGGAGLAHMDKVAFITASRHANVDFVTASCERVDFEAPARLGDIVELEGRLLRVGRRSLAVEVVMTAEQLLSGQRHHCARGVFNMVAVGDRLGAMGGRLPPLPLAADEDPDDGLRMVEMVFPEHTSHYGSLYGGVALAAMGKAAFVAATRRSRMPVVMGASQRVDFASQIGTGELVELVPRLTRMGRTSMTVDVELWAENLTTGERRRSATGSFIMIAVDARHRPAEIPAEAA